MTNIYDTNINNNRKNLVYDTDGHLLFIEATQSNLSLFNVSCNSLILDEDEDFNKKSKSTLNINKHYSSIDIHSDINKTKKRSTMFFSEEVISTQTNTLQRWKGRELLNTCA